jgi:hypothetical protein
MLAKIEELRILEIGKARNFIIKMVKFSAVLLKFKY